MKLTAQSPSFGYGGTGPTLTVAGVTFAVPVGSETRLVRRWDRTEVGYVLDGDRLHAFAAAGEIPMTDELKKKIRVRYFEGKSNPKD